MMMFSGYLISKGRLHYMQMPKLGSKDLENSRSRSAILFRGFVI